MAEKKGAGIWLGIAVIVRKFGVKFYYYRYQNSHRIPSDSLGPETSGSYWLGTM
jgi:hypothetical protein